MTQRLRPTAMGRRRSRCSPIDPSRARAWDTERMVAATRKPTDDQQRYVRRIRQRIRWSDLAMNSRSAGQRAAWVVALIAGAAVTLSEAIGDLTWLPAFLGFVIVVAQGTDRLFARGVEGARSMDAMRRALSKEHRLYDAGAGPYEVAEQPFALFVERCEALLDEYDAQSITHLDTLQAHH